MKNKLFPILLSGLAFSTVISSVTMLAIHPNKSLATAIPQDTTCRYAGSVLNAGFYLLRGDCLLSSNFKYILQLQKDGNLVLYNTTSHRAIWSSRTNGKPVWYCLMQTDGNLVIYDYSNHPLWASNSNRSGVSGPYYLRVQDDGNVVIYGSRAIWATNTVGK